MSSRWEGHSTRCDHATTSPLLDVRHLSVEFATPSGWSRVLDDVSLAVHTGEIVGLVGESGSGKSVTALAAMGLLPQRGARVATGEIFFDGVELLALGESGFQRHQGRDVAMVFQEPMTSLNPVFTVGDQIGESLRRHLGMSRARARVRATEMLHEVGIPNARQRYGSYPHELSGGMRQRVMLAIALACEPKLLIADEPTTALDVTIQAQIIDLIRNLSRQRGIAVLFITHDFGVVAELVDRVQVMYAGQVVESALAEALFHSPRHPYTEALLSCVRSLEGLGELTWLEGGPPRPSERPSGCRFSPRCRYAHDDCRQTEPLLEDLESHGAVRCIRAREIVLTGAD